MSFVLPSLPQNDSPAEQQHRKDELLSQQSTYTYNFESRLQPLGLAAQVPTQDQPVFAWLDGLVTTTIQLLGDYLSLATKYFNRGKALPNERTTSWSEREFQTVEDFHKDLTEGLRDLGVLDAQRHQAPRMTAPTVAVGVTRHSTLLELADRVVEDVTEVVTTAVDDSVSSLESSALVLGIKARVDALHQRLLSDAGELFAIFLGLYGPARELSDYLTPHFQGTLSINDGAEKRLIAPGGPVDLLLSLKIETATQVCVDAVKNQSIKQACLPQALALRGVDDVKALPDYPYRDDGLLLWNDISAWVKDYLPLYYRDDDAVQKDYELQAWIQELSSAHGGKLHDVEEGGTGSGIQTRPYLEDLLTYVIFTASAQHAAVNFPQRTLMSYTPAMPLAAYAPAPTVVEQQQPESEQLAHLPPLLMAMLQQVVGVGLGSIYFTRLGAYDAYLTGHWFQDPAVQSRLSHFQDRLRTTERLIGQRNLSRIPYDTLLPSAIPQSINI